ncbi:MAG: hypothetical protein E2587_10515 [Delftia sp.]|nr:hypothetical protein [Delftia sp.]
MPAKCGDCIPDHPLRCGRAFPLSACFAREGDDTLAAGRPLLGVPDLGRASFWRCAPHGQ